MTDQDPYWAEAKRLLGLDPRSDSWDRKDVAIIANELRTKDKRIDQLEFAQSLRETMLHEKLSAYKIKLKIAIDALETISSKCPVTQEITLAHEMADDADAALIEINGTHR